MTLKILQTIDKIENKNLLELFFVNEKIDVASLTESRVRDDTTTNHCNLNFYGNKRYDGYGGVGIYIKRKFSLINFDNRNEVIGNSIINIKINSIMLSYTYHLTQTDLI